MSNIYKDYDYFGEGFDDMDLVTAGGGYYGMWPLCHSITQIYTNFYLCNAKQILQAMQKGMKFDVLVPLATLSSDIWKFTKPTDTQIFFFPCPDFEVISNNNLEFLVSHIIDFLEQNKKVALFCEEGHGRTGYIASCVLGRLGVKNPIQEIRNRYCEKAVETLSQLESIASFLNIDLSKEIKEMKHKSFISSLIYALCTVIHREEQIANSKLKKGEKKVKYGTEWVYKCTDEELMELADTCGILDKHGNIIYSKIYTNEDYSTTYISSK